MGVVYSAATLVLLREDARAIFFATLILRTLVSVRYVIGRPPDLAAGIEECVCLIV